MRSEEDILVEHPRAKQPLVVRLSDRDFERQVLEALGRLEANVSMLVGNGQPGRMKLAEDRIAALEKSDVRRSVYERVVSAVIAMAVSVLVAVYDHLWKQ
jgi:predicted nicotinamide N-methyase